MAAMPHSSSRFARWRWALGAGLGLLAGAAAVMVLQAPGVRGTLEAALAWIREAGPAPYFTAMALVPAPLAWFTLPAGPAFAGTLGLAGVVAAALLAVAVQITWCYLAARYWFRPPIERWLRARGHIIPTVGEGNAVAVILMVRLVPGPPLPLQCCLLGLAQVPFGPYWLVSWLLTVPWVVGGVVFGRGVLGGNVVALASGVSVLAAASVAVWWWRRRMDRPVA